MMRGTMNKYIRVLLLVAATGAALQCRGPIANKLDSGRGEQLCESARRGDIEGVKKLLDSKVDPNYSTKSGITPLVIACGEGHIQVFY